MLVAMSESTSLNCARGRKAGSLGTTRALAAAKGTIEQAAAIKAARHAGTPTTAYFDALGRPFMTLVNNGAQPNGTAIQYPTRVQIDIEGNQREVVDALGRVVLRCRYDLLGGCIYQASIDAGTRWKLNDAAGNPIRVWDSRGHQFRTIYDRLRRPIEHYAAGEESELPDQRLRNRSVMLEKIEYGEGQANDVALNLRTRVFRRYDGAGVTTNKEYDFKGNLRLSSRTLADDYRKLYNWSVDSIQPSWEGFSSSARYDALNRPVELVAPHRNAPEDKANKIRLSYNKSNLLNAVEVNLSEEVDQAGELKWTPFVSEIDYDAKGQRTFIAYGNVDARGTRKTVYTTEYDYDPTTFRLTHLKSGRPDFPTARQVVQDVAYTYDPVGNITNIEDNAQSRAFFDNDCIEPSSDYLYDALYRLIGAKGREHWGDKAPTGPYDNVRKGNPITYDCSAIQHYVEKYEYDAVGNVLGIVHHKGSNVQIPGPVVWRRRHQYATLNNRLRSTSMPGEPAKPFYSDDPADAYHQVYGYDEHGNVTSMPHLDLMQWDYRDQLQVTARQVVSNAPPHNTVQEKTWYVYDADGRRVRKVTDRQNGKRKSERIYLAGFEIYREFDIGGYTKTLERETLHGHGRLEVHCPSLRRAQKGPMLHPGNLLVTSLITIWARPAWNWTIRRRLFRTKNITHTVARAIRLYAGKQKRQSVIASLAKNEMKKTAFIIMVPDTTRPGWQGFLRPIQPVL